MSRAQFAGDPVDVPRRQSGPNSQALLAALVADYSYGSKDRIPSAAIIKLLGEFGISPTGARSALSRVTRRGLLTPSKIGRQTYYTVGEVNLEARMARLRGYIDFGAQEEEWDGTWTVVVFTISEEDRVLRSRLRGFLERSGFAPMIDAVWVRHGDHFDAVEKMGVELGVRQAVMLSRFLGGEGINPVDAFDLPRIRALYESFLDEYEPLLARFDAGKVGASEAMVARANLLDTWRTIALEDPDLPHVLLPHDWPQARARDVFIQLWERSRNLSRLRIRDIVREIDPAFASAATDS